jgi:branched-chain amino acid aminotransferase
MANVSHLAIQGNYIADIGLGWLPKSQPGTFLYLRPAIIGNGEQLGVSLPSEVLLFIIAVPWPDLSTGTPPGAPPKPPGLKLLASRNDTRAWPGGFGYAKVGANYGPAFVSKYFLFWFVSWAARRLITPNGYV